MENDIVVRKVDPLGRVVLPVKLRKKLGIGTNDPVEMFLDNGKIQISKYSPKCIFCGSTNGVSNYKGKNICTSCVENLK